MSAFQQLLQEYRSASKTEREKGNYFELLSKSYFENDKLQQQYFSKVWLFSDWAKEQGLNGTDTGIDLVAQRRDGEGYCAIQCKFYASDYVVQKSDIDSFFTASGKRQFTRRLIVDTSLCPWSKNAEDALKGQQIEISRIRIGDFEHSNIDWQGYLPGRTVKTLAKKSLRDHQIEALDAVKSGLATADRGNLIMACGTGKTYTSLCIAEQQVGLGGMVLFLVPSLALMSQTVREWGLDASIPLRCFAACSDTQVGKRKRDDNSDIEIHDLAFPATTDAKALVQTLGKPQSDVLTVVFSTYQSIEVIGGAQKDFGLPAFDLVICDEAHRTTGVTLSETRDSNFVKVHDETFLKAKKRLYMTATPKIFTEAAQKKARDLDADPYSWDNEKIFGKTLLHKSFSWAVSAGLLTDYKVIVLAVDEGIVSQSIQQRFVDSGELTLDDASKMVGCYKALTKSDLLESEGRTLGPMKRALAFCDKIATSKRIQKEFPVLVREYRRFMGDDVPALDVEIEHVDGTFNAKTRGDLLEWLQADIPEQTCRVLTNARCLSEGVDVPALDAIMFLHPRKSVIDVVQSVGRVMRRAEGKSMGYVILPVTIPAGMAPEEALKNNERYRVVWQILNALRSHDESMDATINQASLGEDISERVEILGIRSKELYDTIARVEALPGAVMAKDSVGIGTRLAAEGDAPNSGISQQYSLSLIDDELTRALKAKIVEKCGQRDYWENWARDIAQIAERHITRLNTIVGQDSSPQRQKFLEFLDEIRDDLNPEISEADAIEMLAQHLITKPVFDALFQDNVFTRQNPVSRAISQVLAALEPQNLATETKQLERFYTSVQSRAKGIKTSQGKQALVVELYDKFFKGAFPKLTEKMGIVYTPVEVVDFIIHSVNDVLKDEFGTTLGAEGVHILDPFTGTGTFITRLLQSGLITSDQLAYKYKKEIHANEIILLAYYIAAINIESVYHELAGQSQTYSPFKGICLTDTFQLYEQEKDMIAKLLPDNSERRTAQKQRDIRVIIGNPPYSSGQKSANDNAANMTYENLDAKIRSTYARHSSATNKNALYDSYIRAMRWGSDRLQEKGSDQGILAFVSSAGWVDGNATDGLRKCLVEEFSSLYIFHLRGNQRTSGELSRKEGGKIFGSGSRTPIAISVLVRNPQAKNQGQIYFHDIGDYLSQKEKLDKITAFKSIAGIAAQDAWQPITADENHDWLDQVDQSFERFLSLGDKKDKTATTIFNNYSSGVKTQRDAWCYNSSEERLTSNICRMIDFYNLEVRRFEEAGRPQDTDKFLDWNPERISWTRALKWDLEKSKKISFESKRNRVSCYRPFQKQWQYFDRCTNEMIYQMQHIFPNAETENQVICVSGIGARAGFSALMTNALPNLHTLDTGQCFPLYLYEEAQAEAQAQDSFLSQKASGLQRKDGISDAALRYFQTAYPGEALDKQDLFYYVYGLLHSPEYRARFRNNLMKALPRIPAVKQAQDFLAFSQAGRALAELHLGFETVTPYPVTIEQGDLRLAQIEDPQSYYRVEKMVFAKQRKDKDKTRVHYNKNITMTAIPLRAYDYIVNGKPALEWVMERQCVKTDKASGIVNDANDYANETMGNPAYPLELFQRLITVSLETLDIVAALPQLDID